MRPWVVIREAIGNMFILGVIAFLFLIFAASPLIHAFNWFLDFLGKFGG